MEEKWVLDKVAAGKKWSKFSQDDLDRASGSKLELVDFVRDRYGVTFEEASKQVDDFEGGEQLPSSEGWKPVKNAKK